MTTLPKDAPRDQPHHAPHHSPHDLQAGAAQLAQASHEEQATFLAALTPAELQALPYIFDFWAHAHQLAPPGDWRTWVIMGGRGAGKTRAGAEWVRARVEGARRLQPGTSRRVALLGETYDQAREVMVFGDSGLLACAPPDRRPEWIATRRMLVWPNGATAQLFSASEPEALRGPQFDAVWADELAKWKKADEAWDMMQFALRLGQQPQACVTTTPRNIALLKTVLARASTVVSHAPTTANRANLAPGFLAEVQTRYAGSSLGRQELDGLLLDDIDGALWTYDMLQTCQTDSFPPPDRIVVAVDPPVSGRVTSDDCGIIVLGVVMQGPPQSWRAYVLEDATVSAASPDTWARAAVAAFHRHKADRLVAEVNQGGALVEAMIRMVDQMIPYRAVHATRGKVVRAEPAATLYEQGRVFHVRGLGALEDQMAAMTRAGFAGKGSPDRVDALVWALYDAMIAPAALWQRPRLRRL